ncbi:hypothetical protein [Massilia sp. Root418]|uniref:hypothetical protein n=1 Tax=Massilia sp. Root418 TaxID=1736532 RepID=UPI000A7231FE|nr:hypothetical protein [Massilia sp. Root418]
MIHDWRAFWDGFKEGFVKGMKETPRGYFLPVILLWQFLRSQFSALWRKFPLKM